MRKRLLAASVASGLVLLFGLVGAPLAQAFSAYGAGTSDSPYRIATCDQLSEIDNDLAADYVIIRNLNCTGAAFNTLAQSNPFTGTLDGQWHTISNLGITNGKGLFWQVDGGTVKNLSIASGNAGGSSSNQVGSFAGFAENDAVFQDLHSAMTIAGRNSCAGIVGDLNTGSSIADSSFTGNISCGSEGGGIAGDVFGFGDGESISNSFSSGTFHAVDPGMGIEEIGGLVGNLRATNESITDSYSSMTMNIDTGGNAQDIGGLAGYASTNTISDSFSASTINAPDADFVGGIDGGNSATYANDYFDQTLAGGIDCTGTGTATGCTAVNTDGNSGNYFKNNTANGPLANWDFSNTWQQVSGYPTLTSLLNYSTDAGDLNGDGTDDSFQPTVETEVDEQGDTPINTTVTIPTNSTCTLDQASWANVNYYKADTGFTNPNRNFTAFNVYCPTAGMTVPVTIVFDTAYDTSHAVLQYFDMNTHTYTTVPNATFATQTINGTPHTTVTYSLTDGGPYDSDGVANGLIQDPVGMVVPVTGGGGASQGGQSGGTLSDTGLDITLTASLAATIMALAIVVRLLPSFRKD